MRNVQKCGVTYTNNVTDISLRVIINGQYKRTMSQEDLEIARFMIGGLDSK